MDKQFEQWLKEAFPVGQVFLNDDALTIARAAFDAGYTLGWGGAVSSIAGD